MIGRRVGYVRVSSFDQNPERQLEDVDLDRTFSDKASGKDAKRPQLEALMTFVRVGETVVVHSMDRLARNLDDLRQIVQTLTRRGIHIEYLKKHLTFTGEDSPMANLMLSVMGAFAELAISAHPLEKFRNAPISYSIITEISGASTPGVRTPAPIEPSDPEKFAVSAAAADRRANDHCDGSAR
jgi:Resolvase, N terminal domain